MATPLDTVVGVRPSTAPLAADVADLNARTDKLAQALLDLTFLVVQVIQRLEGSEAALALIFNVEDNVAEQRDPGDETEAE